MKLKSLEFMKGAIICLVKCNETNKQKLYYSTHTLFKSNIINLFNINLESPLLFSKKKWKKN